MKCKTSQKTVDGVVLQTVLRVGRLLKLRTLEIVLVGFRSKSERSTFSGIELARLATCESATFHNKRDSLCSWSGLHRYIRCIRSDMWRGIDSGGHEANSPPSCFVIVRQVTGNPVARIPALCISIWTKVNSLSGSEGESIILRVDECLLCCLRNALSEEKRVVQIVF